MTDTPLYGAIVPGQIKILFMDGSWINVNKPPGFELSSFIHGARSLGFIITNSFYFPFGMVKLIMDMDANVNYGTAPAPPQSNAPTTETKQ